MVHMSGIKMKHASAGAVVNKFKTRAWLAAVGVVAGCTDPAPPPGLDIPVFEEIPVLFDHRWADGSHPFSGAAAIDVDMDGAFEIFVGGGRGQADALLTLNNGRLVDFISDTGLSESSVATHGATAIDLNDDGLTDLIVAREDGVHIYYREGDHFRAQELPLNLDSHSVPFAVTVADFDRDGDGDLYVSAFVSFPEFKSATYNEPEHAKSNRLLRNEGDGTFIDVTEQAGVGASQNTFLSVFVDLDADTWPDLVVSQNTGQVEFYRNNHDGSFSRRTIAIGYGFWMGMAVGDIDKDGDPDLLFSNVGKSIPKFLTRGDLRDDQAHDLEWALLKNNGDFELQNVTAEYGLAKLGFGWGAVFEDLNLDGHLDLLAAQNYIKWPLHKLTRLPGVTALQATQDGQARFFQAAGLGLQNKYFAQSPLVADLDGDGRQDLLWLNMNGPMRAFLNRSDSHFLTVSMADTVTNQGVRLRLETADGTSYARELLSGVGLMTDQTPDLSFGLGDTNEVQVVTATWPDGTVITMASPPIDTVIRIDHP